MSAVAVEETPTSTLNPLDIVEEIVVANEWPFDRSNEDELIVEIAARWCDYRLYFVWQGEVSAMQFSCQFDMKATKARRHELNELLSEVNAKMWLGHFDVCPDEHTPMFRHTTLLRGAPRASVEQMEDLVEIALMECERFYPAFQFVISGGKSASEAVTAAILDTVGEA
ncbi:YbjN domain-containing protein [Skermanella rosea]|uniref:YbjN domain-containing protein n=1 Tax=Skermanella cutis TaxID=2775420 RepID=A0ABX7BDH3_9PROT|nr:MULTISPECIES: YbjN domain-containing protein [Skermanella]QQP90482.1 YbjN domain-containing protein [Skermanella sp. TT6]UEM04659.1 YbjN domain-containing protein [Skermanella rosea]